MPKCSKYRSGNLVLLLQIIKLIDAKYCIFFAPGALPDDDPTRVLSVDGEFISRLFSLLLFVHFSSLKKENFGI